jgi:hypothetical protein
MVGMIWTVSQYVESWRTFLQNHHGRVEVNVSDSQ